VVFVANHIRIKQEDGTAEPSLVANQLQEGTIHTAQDMHDLKVRDRSSSVWAIGDIHTLHQ
jgi:hypothetical protein